MPVPFGPASSMRCAAGSLIKPHHLRKCLSFNCEPSLYL